jgi:hypothetical protein
MAHPGLRNCEDWHSETYWHVRFWPFATDCSATQLGRQGRYADIDRRPSVAEGDARPEAGIRLGCGRHCHN